MDAIEPVEGHAGAKLIVFALEQPEYDTLPLYVDSEGLVMTEWEPTTEELNRLLSGGRVRIWLHYMEVHKGKAMNPMSVEVTEPLGGMRGT